MKGKWIIKCHVSIFCSTKTYAIILLYRSPESALTRQRAITIYISRTCPDREGQNDNNDVGMIFLENPASTPRGLN